MRAFLITVVVLLALGAGGLFVASYMLTPTPTTVEKVIPDETFQR